MQRQVLHLKDQGSHLEDTCKTNCQVCIYYLGTLHAEENSEVENVQCKAVQYVMSDWKCTSSITNMLKILEWQSLEQHRAQTWVMMLYKIAINIIPSLYLQSAVVRADHAMQFIIPRSRVAAYQHSFFPGAIRLWYRLPSDMNLLPVKAFCSHLADIQFY